MNAEELVEGFASLKKRLDRAMNYAWRLRLIVDPFTAKDVAELNETQLTVVYEIRSAYYRLLNIYNDLLNTETLAMENLDDVLKLDSPSKNGKGYQ